MSSQPSPSTSRKAQPAPIVSGSQRLPVRPALWTNLIPDEVVTSVKRTAGSVAPQRSIAPLRIVVVNRLPLIVVLGPGETGLLGERLGSLVGFEAAEELLLARGFGDLAETPIGKHQVVMRLDVLGVDGQSVLEGLDGRGVLAFQKLDAAVLVDDHAV